MAGALPRPAPQASDIASVVLDGLSQPQKRLPPFLFYDAVGSELFELITQLPEYYPTRVETAILAAHAREIATSLAEGGVLVELGSGSSRKTELLLAAMPRLRAYVPLDVSSDALRLAERRLRVRFPALDIRPIMGDFAGHVALPADIVGAPRMGFFPGSTIGNLTPLEAVRLLERLGAGLLRGGGLVIGVDLKKDRGTLERAYNDAAGITAAFNLNVLARINREIAPAFNEDAFAHEARYDPTRGRIEMHLVSRKPQTVPLLGRRFHFRAGETIHTESSYKYTVEEFGRLCRSAGWQPQQVWTDAERMFSVHALAAPG